MTTNPSIVPTAPVMLHWPPPSAVPTTYPLPFPAAPESTPHPERIRLPLRQPCRQERGRVSRRIGDVIQFARTGDVKSWLAAARVPGTGVLRSVPFRFGRIGDSDSGPAAANCGRVGDRRYFALSVTASSARRAAAAGLRVHRP